MLLIIPLPAACLNACLWFCTHHHSEQPHSKQKQHTVLFSQFSSHFGYSLFLVYCFWLDRWSTSKFLLNETELFSRSILVKMELLLRKQIWFGTGLWRGQGKGKLEDTACVVKLLSWYAKHRHTSALGCHFAFKRRWKKSSFRVGIRSKLLKPWFSFLFLFHESVFLFSKQLNAW